MAVPEKSKFAFRRVEVFDPKFSIGLALVIAAACIALGAAGDFPLPFIAILVAVIGFWAINRSDTRRPSCVSVRLDASMIQDVDILDHKITAKVWVGSGSVARLGRALGRSAQLPLRPGLRELPILLVDHGSASAWVESGKLLHLNLDEVRGALSVVLSGSDLTLELLVGMLPGSRPTLLGTLLSSREGSIQSWSPGLRPVLPLDPVVPSFPRLTAQ